MSTAVSGRVKRIRFQKGFFVIAEILDAQEKIVLVKGQMPGVYEGDLVRLVGRNESNSKWGDQFLIESCDREERNGIETVLSLLPDVGPARAKKIRETFGDADVFRIIEKEPHRLKEISGLTDDRIVEIRKVCLERKAERDLLLWCGTNGVSAYHSSNIWAKFGAQSLRVLKETPYEIVRAEHVGFLTADRIARRAGADANGIDRAKAAILYVLSEAEASDGSTVVPADMVLAACRGAERGPGGQRTACQLSPSIPDDVTYKAIGLLKSEREIYLGGGDQPLIQRGITRKAEKELAELIVSFSLTPATIPPRPPSWIVINRALDDDLKTPWGAS